VAAQTRERPPKVTPTQILFTNNLQRTRANQHMHHGRGSTWIQTHYADDAVTRLNDVNCGRECSEAEATDSCFRRRNWRQVPLARLECNEVQYLGAGDVLRAVSERCTRFASDDVPIAITRDIVRYRQSSRPDIGYAASDMCTKRANGLVANFFWRKQESVPLRFGAAPPTISRHSSA